MRQQCDGCEIEGKLLCIHTHKDLADFFVLFLGWVIPFIAGMVIGNFWAGLLAWVVLAVLFFGYVEALLLCRHCPHYMEKGFLLRCHANWGLPKIPKLNTKPMNTAEKVIWLIYVAVLFLFYVPFFIISKQWLLLTLTTSALITAAWTLQRTQCNRCYHLSCPANRVPDDVKEVFYKNYPEFEDSRKDSSAD
ncbi:MAG: hypothetical protein JRJ39_03190 [Deltaproteobacteria bacterium]|nr:hypothetical protein [Deltaproteobacteria bacterium]MBW1812699.1 hypothetical protein [Deltaproteobacteria bacterium]MBW1846647.1 hypothetical protein [Deltaproteobacteria bacterium]MBW1985354.1 hypothetical protein [Deltaproteobacteria bacterium]MBW2364670.1 hypothetical protein [Deltaproteobacteria bacterium]